MMPGMGVHIALPPALRGSVVVQWTLMVLNSLLWGVAIYFICRRIVQRVKGARR